MSSTTVSIRYTTNGGMQDIGKLADLDMDYNVVNDVKDFLRKNQRPLFCYITPVPFLVCIFCLMFVGTIPAAIILNLRMFPFGMLFVPLTFLLACGCITIEKGCDHRRLDHSQMLIQGVNEVSGGRIRLSINYRSDMKQKSRNLITSLVFVVHKEVNA